MLVRVQGLGENLVARHNHDDGKIFVHQRQHAVLELARHDSLAVKIRNLLDLEGAYSMRKKEGNPNQPMTRS